MKSLIKAAFWFVVGYAFGHLSREEIMYSAGTLYDWIAHALYSLFN